MSARWGRAVSDALLRAWYEKPMVISYIFDPDKTKEKIYRISKTTEQQAEDERLISIINQALGDELITDILVTTREPAKWAAVRCQNCRLPACSVARNLRTVRLRKNRISPINGKIAEKYR